MRDRKEIEADWDKTEELGGYEVNLILEVLLDIRDQLTTKT